MPRDKRVITALPDPNGFSTDLIGPEAAVSTVFQDGANAELSVDGTLIAALARITATDIEFWQSRRQMTKGAATGNRSGRAVRYLPAVSIPDAKNASIRAASSLGASSGMACPHCKARPDTCVAFSLQVASTS